MAHREEDPSDSTKASVLLFTKDVSTGKAYVAALEKADVAVEWVTSASALRSRLRRSDLPKPGLVMVLPARQKSIPPGDLASVASRLAPELDVGLGAQGSTSELGESLNDYCSWRSLSRRQRQVLELYLVGNNDKEIADSFSCSATTVYEHWRRMAKKVAGKENGVHKSDVINDFHRFLATRSDPVDALSPSLLESSGSTPLPDL